jgi:hypothetical protein
MVECNWEFADGHFKTDQIAFPWSKVKEMVEQIQRVSSSVL